MSTKDNENNMGVVIDITLRVRMILNFWAKAVYFSKICPAIL